MITENTKKIFSNAAKKTEAFANWGEPEEDE